ncbi:hypothetical protein [Streptomyces sp. NPDC090022]|uniref:hypothetical protein n=1 Tax=Streptomyces sp. NPDC090022 TaxID=3365920 RepID=UPI00380BB9CF
MPPPCPASAATRTAAALADPDAAEAWLGDPWFPLTLLEAAVAGAADLAEVLPAVLAVLPRLLPPADGFFAPWSGTRGRISLALGARAFPDGIPAAGAGGLTPTQRTLLRAGLDRLGDADDVAAWLMGGTSWSGTPGVRSGPPARAALAELVHTHL